MSYLVFPTQEAAITADSLIADNFGMGRHRRDATERYQTELQQTDGTWYLTMPPPVTVLLPPVFTVSEPLQDGTPTGAWTFPTTSRDSLTGVVGFTVVEEVTPMPITTSKLPLHSTL